MILECAPGSVPSGPVCLAHSDVSGPYVRNLAHRILAERQFRQPKPALITRFDKWLARTLDHIFTHLFNNGQFTVLGAIIAAGLVLGAVALAVRFGARVKRDPGVDIKVQRPTQRTPREWAAEAARHEAAGAWRDALRCRYRGLVAELASREIVEEIPGRTAREYAEIVRRRLPGASEEFSEASSLFETAWYGSRTTSQADHERFTRLARDVRAEARTHASLDPHSATTSGARS
jgi:Domain of unknown function (DUF4129)